MRKEPKFAEPPEFDGKPSEYASFINSCDLFFRMRSVTFDNDYVKVAYVISRCRGSPAEWGHSLIESSSDVLHDYDAFKEQLSSMYADKLRRKTLRRKLTMLKQTGSASKFAAEFKSTANILGIDDECRFALFTNALKPEVQRALALVRDIDTFDDLVDAAVQIDHVNFTLAKAESKADSKSSSTKPTSQGKGNTPSSSHPQQPRTDSASSTTSRTSAPKSNNPISQEEKDRREALGLCRFCGGNHFKRDYPSLKAKLEKEANKGLIYVPETLRMDLLREHHDAPLAGPCGIARTLELVTRNYWCPGINAFVKDYVNSCFICQQAKAPRHLRHGELSSLPVPTAPWKGLTCDFITDLPVSSGMDCILVFVDRMTKMSHFIPCTKTTDASVFAKLFVSNVVRLHGLPDTIVSDRGSILAHVV